MNRIIFEDAQQILRNNLPWAMLKNKSVLVTGASGMIPSYVVHTLLELNKMAGTNIQVYALGRNLEKLQERFSYAWEDVCFHPMVQNIAETFSFPDKLDVIIHGASQASPKYFGKDPVGTLNANVLGTDKLLRLGKEKNIEKFLFMSTGEVYGVSLQEEGVTERDYGYIDILNVRSCYAESKRMAETMCVSWQHQFGVPVFIARIFHTYGPELEMDDGRVFADFISDIVENRNIVLNSAGTARRPFCYMTDCICGLFTILLKGNNGEAYNVANDKQYVSIKELADTLVSLYPEKNLIVEQQIKEPQSGYLQSGLKDTFPCTDKLRALGWNPSVDIRDGFMRVITSLEISKTH